LILVIRVLGVVGVEVVGLSGNSLGFRLIRVLLGGLLVEGLLTGIIVKDVLVVLVLLIL
jgi:hypothetical protein